MTIDCKTKMNGLTTREIFYAIMKDEFARFDFKGVLPIDKLPTKVKYPSSFVVNNQTSKQKGEHWFALYYDSDGTCTFFDSLAMGPGYYKIENYLNKTSKHFIYNSQQLQSFFSSTCGHYCIYFILLKSRNLSLEDILNLLHSNNFILNDLKISNIYP